MTLDELIKVFRIEAQDRVAPHIFEQDDVADWLIEAEQEAVIRGRLIHEVDNLQVCQIRLVRDQTTYKLHPAVYEIDYIAYWRDSADDPYTTYIPEPCAIKLVSREWMDANHPGWRDTSWRCCDRFAIQDDTSIRFTWRPTASVGIVRIECYRLPMRGLSRDKASTPEIHVAHHRHLVEWALYRAFRLPDNDAMNIGQSDEALAQFTQYFGLRPDSDLRRITRHDVVHHVEAAWP